MGNWHETGSRWGFHFGRKGAMTYMIDAPDGEPVTGGYHGWSREGDVVKDGYVFQIFQMNTGAARFEVLVRETDDGEIITTDERPLNPAAESMRERQGREEQYGLASLKDEL